MYTPNIENYQTNYPNLALR